MDDIKHCTEVDTEGNCPDLPEGTRRVMDILSKTKKDSLPAGQDVKKAPPMYKPEGPRLNHLIH